MDATLAPIHAVAADAGAATLERRRRYDVDAGYTDGEGLRQETYRWRRSANMVVLDLAIWQA